MDLIVHLNGTKLVYEPQLQSAQPLFAAISQAEDASRSAAAALALLTWDILTTVDDEILYLFVRYYSLIGLVIQNAQIIIPCVPWLIFQITSLFLVEAAVEVLMMFRVHAVYAAQPKIMRIMLFGFAIQVALMSVSLGLSIDKVKTGWYCKSTDLPTEMVIYSTASIVYEAFLFVLMMYGVIRGTKEGFSDTTLMNELVRGGAVAFVAVFSVMIMNTILFTLAPSTLVTLGFPWLLAILGSAGPRLILNVRASHANARSKGPSSFAHLHLTMSAHSYSALDRNLNDPASAGYSSSMRGESSSFPLRDRDGDGDLEWDSDSDLDLDDEASESTALNRRRHDLESASSSEIGSRSPPSPLSPRTT
ncbi:hypothetical protein BN946_scf184989.g3 [Trametes cinnabarina]|uniref:Uncharacterized protein n=1 Tax=Pycnoporus cinnabarinus TaxID=5643 RepID=A0A060S2X4_PYCCI|nr:hypothetical protein BN946_scf184989.g3 [Trametes cinnabarina]